MPASQTTYAEWLSAKSSEATGKGKKKPAKLRTRKSVGKATKSFSDDSDDDFKPKKGAAIARAQAAGEGPPAPRRRVVSAKKDNAIAPNKDREREIAELTAKDEDSDVEILPVPKAKVTMAPKRKV